MPAYEDIRTLETRKRGTHLIVAHLVLHLIFPENRTQLDHICVLWNITMNISPKGGGKARTAVEYAFPVPSKHNISVRGFLFA
jgi:hypothetical protein